MTAIIVREWPTTDYAVVWQAMQTFTNERQADTPDEVWLVEHPPVFTLGQNGKPEHILQVVDIPIVKTDRGGQVTYHGPGQIMIYTLINIQRRQWGVRQLVTLLEQLAIKVLDSYGISAYSKPDAPGVYVNGAKICSIGLRIRRGCSYHGLAFNVDMDLRPFEFINPCGYPNLAMTQLRDLGVDDSMSEVKARFVAHIHLILS